MASAAERWIRMELRPDHAHRRSQQMSGQKSRISLTCRIEIEIGQL
jgi:hypothetical protein